MNKPALLLGLFGLGALLLAGDETPAAPPSELDDYAARDLTTGCDPTEKQGAMKLRAFILEHFGGADWGITRECHIGSPSEHHEGRAFDWGIVDGGADVDAFLDWLLSPDGFGRPHANARAAGVMYAIYDRRIWRSYDKPGQPRGHWYPYFGDDPHVDHVHISLSRAGGDGLTSLYS